MPTPPVLGCCWGCHRAAGVAGWTWLARQSPAFRAGIELVVIDPSAPYAAEIRAALPHAWIALDHWHLVRLANEMVTEVRQRVARQRHGRRGIKADPVWAHRRMLLTAGDRLSAHQLSRLRWILAQDDPTDEICAAWGCTQLLRQLLAETDPNRIRHRLWRFYDACARADMDETTCLAAQWRLGGRPSQWPWPNRSPTPAPRASTESSNRSSVSAADSQHGQLSTPHHGPHRSHPTARTSGMTRPPRAARECTHSIYPVDVLLDQIHSCDNANW
jgi:transposase